MRVMRAEPGRFTDATARSVGAIWRSYDLQLTIYAALLGVFGLVMAYTNSVEAGQSVMDSGTVFSRALMWSGLAIVAFIAATAFDYRWLKTLVWPIYVINLAPARGDARHRRRRRRLGALGRRSARSRSSSPSSPRS